MVLLLAQLDAGVTIAFLALAVTVVGTGFAVGFRLGRTEEKITSEITALRAWVADLAAGKGPVCAQHGEKIAFLEKRTDGHEKDIRDQQQQIAAISRVSDM